MTPQSIDRDPAFEAEVREYLEARGYRVTKTRPKPQAYSAVGYDIRTCIHCGNAATITTKVGARKPKDRTLVAVCEDCYRFGAGLHQVPNVPADPIRYARIRAAWQHAQHRYHSTIRQNTYSGEYSAHPRLIAITRALNAEPFVRTLDAARLSGLPEGAAA